MIERDGYKHEFNKGLNRRERFIAREFLMIGVVLGFLIAIVWYYIIQVW